MPLDVAGLHACYTDVRNMLTAVFESVRKPPVQIVLGMGCCNY